MINMIIAIDAYGGIGKNGNLPWRIPEDLKAFKDLTMDGILFVGKKTAKTLPPLKGREIIVLSRNEFPTFHDIISNKAWENRAKWIIGGSVIYQAALDLEIVDRVYLTTIDKKYDADTYFPSESLQKFQNENWAMNNETVLRSHDPYVTMQEWNKLK